MHRPSRHSHPSIPARPAGLHARIYFQPLPSGLIIRASWLLCVQMTTDCRASQPASHAVACMHACMGRAVIDLPVNVAAWMLSLLVSVKSSS